MKIKMVHADNMEELFVQVSEVDKAQDVDDELFIGSTTQPVMMRLTRLMSSHWFATRSAGSK